MMIQAEIKEDSQGRWVVEVNEVSVVRFMNKKNALEYIRDLRTLNKGREIVATIGGLKL